MEKAMQEDRIYCMNSFLMYRFTVDGERCFSKEFLPYYLAFPADRAPVGTGEELIAELRRILSERCRGRKCALALSGGIDSAILLALVPENTVCYTFRCVVPGMQVTDETRQAETYLRFARPELEHRIVEIFWEDFRNNIDGLLRHKGAPTHSIEVQCYKAAMQAKRDGCDLMIFGETADCIYGGHSQLLSRDWTFDEFLRRWSFVWPEEVLREPLILSDPIRPFLRENGLIDVPAFLNDFEAEPSLNFYWNACACAEIELLAPYSHTIRRDPLDIERVRRGENKYIVREAFAKLYPAFTIPPKTPMPRAMNEWLADWAGPVRREFLPGCVKDMTGDQKWLVWVLERFLDLIEGKNG